MQTTDLEQVGEFVVVVVVRDIDASHMRILGVVCDELDGSVTQVAMAHEVEEVG